MNMCLYQYMSTPASAIALRKNKRGLSILYKF